MKKKILLLVGTVVKNLSNLMFLVNLNKEKKIICYISGKMRINYIKLLPGDQVKIEFDPNGNKGRIIYRMK
ncbi:translation initiation factor IF-1 [Candidatus Vidania fulgoroideorum]